MKQIIFYLLLITLGLNLTLNAQSDPFVNLNLDFDKVHFSSLAWGDYDGDNDQDVIVMGLRDDDAYSTKLYKNKGNDTFVSIVDFAIPGLAHGDVVWGDYDNDNDLDILIQGTNGGQFTKIYENLGNDQFQITDFPFIQVYDGAVAFADFNNDTYLDVFITGFDGSGVVAVLYKNNNGESFSETDVVFPAVFKTSSEWVDIDNDGDLDHFLTGFDYTNFIANLYINNGDETFTESTSSFEGVWLGDASFGDYNGDDYQDLLLSGFTNGNSRITKVYKNNGDASFTEQTDIVLTGVSHSTTIWGDYDDDGDLDIYLTGVNEASKWEYPTKIFRNDGNNNFVETSIVIESNYWGESAFSDYDNDGDIDLIISGYDGATGLSKTIIYKNTPETNIEDTSTPLSDHKLKQNYPNPFNPVTKIRYGLAVNSEQLAKIVVYNATGQMVWSSNPSSLNPNTCTFDGSKFNSGIYYYSLVIDGKKMDTKSMVLIK